MIIEGPGGASGLQKNGLARVAIGVLGIAIAFLPLLIDPGVGHVGDLGDEREFLAAEAGRSLPFVAVLVEARDGQDRKSTRLNSSHSS